MEETKTKFCKYHASEILMSFRWSCRFKHFSFRDGINFCKTEKKNLLAGRGYEVFPEWIDFKANAENRE